MAVVKANGYGHGAARLLPALAAADMLGVACIEEALALREAGATQPILLMEGVFEADELPLCARLGFEIAVHEPGQLAMLEAARLERPLDRLAQGRQRHEPAGLPARGRAGCLARLQRLRRRGARLRLMTHFASADEPDRPRHPRQIERFAAAAGLGLRALVLQLGRGARLARGPCRVGAARASCSTACRRWPAGPAATRACGRS